VAKTHYSAETRAKAVRLVREHAGDYPSEYAAMTAVAQRLGIGSAETLRKWVRQAETDEGRRPGLTTAEAAEVRALRRKVSELERTITILTEATRLSPGRPPAAGAAASDALGPAQSCQMALTGMARSFGPNGSVALPV